jgi:hypothetical protein
VPGFDEFVRDHVGDVGAFSTSRYCSDHSELIQALPCFRVLWNDTLLQSFNVLHVSKMYFMKNKRSCCMRLEVILYFHYWYFVSSWNQRGVLHSKWIPMFVTVLPVPQNQEHPDRTVSSSYLPGNCTAANISLLESHQRQQHEMLGPVVKYDKLGNHYITHTDDHIPIGWMAKVSLKAAIP